MVGSVSGVSPPARSPRFSSTPCQAVMPCQRIHGSTLGGGCPAASISPAHPAAPPSLALVTVLPACFGVLGREQAACGRDFAACGCRGLVLVAQTSLPSCHPAAGLAGAWDGAEPPCPGIPFALPCMSTKVWLPDGRKRNKILAKTLTWDLLLGFDRSSGKKMRNE